MAKLNILEALTKVTRHILSYISEVDTKTRMWAEEHIKNVEVDEEELDWILKNKLDESTSMNVRVIFTSNCYEDNYILTIQYTDTSGQQITKQHTSTLEDDVDGAGTKIILENVNSDVYISYSGNNIKVTLNDEVLYDSTQENDKFYKVAFNRLSSGDTIHVYGMYW